MDELMTTNDEKALRLLGEGVSIPKGLRFNVAFLIAEGYAVFDPDSRHGARLTKAGRDELSLLKREAQS